MVANDSNATTETEAKIEETDIFGARLDDLGYY
jgi:hypothetical protein